MLGKYKLTPQALLSIIVLVLVGLVLAGYFIFSGSNSTSEHIYKSELVIANSSAGNVYLTDQTGKQVSKAAYTKFSYLTYQAVAPNGGILADTNAGSDNESFIFTRSNALKTFTGDTAKLLHSAVAIQSSHQIFFIDEKSVILLSCSDPSDSCLLQRLNLSSGASSKILDTGVKLSNSYMPSVYLVGYSTGRHLAYVKVINAKNKMGGSTNAVYEIDTTSSKVTRSFDMPVLANFTTSLSPDGTKLAYTTIDVKNNIIVHVLDLNSKKNQKINWNKGSLLDSPSTLRWSADSTKLLVQTANVTVSAGKSQTLPVIAYIDLSNDNTVHTIQQTKDPSHESVYSFGWLDNDQIVYQIKKPTTANGLAGTTSQTLKQNISGASPTALKVPAGDLAQAALY